MVSIKVLLVDDEEELLDTLGKRLNKRGFAVTTAVSGEEALAELQAGDHDVVILDVFMPGKGGIETLKEMKVMKPLAEVIMLSGQATLELAIEGMQHGAFDFLVKPAAMGDLVEKINKAYARKVDHDERIRKAGFVKEHILAAPSGDREAADKPAGLSGLPADSHRLLVIGRDSDFPRELIEYALDLSKRMSYAILALNAAGFDSGSFKHFPAARQRVCRDFQEISEKNAAFFERLARKESIPFAHVVKFCGHDEAIAEIVSEAGHVDYAVSESEEGPEKGQIVAYCPV
ncbi:MAG: response regulator [Elusimicrobiota bacterium]